MTFFVTICPTAESSWQTRHQLASEPSKFYPVKSRVLPNQGPSNAISVVVQCLYLGVNGTQKPLPIDILDQGSGADE